MKLKDIKKLVDLLGECEITPYNAGIHLLDKKRVPFAEINFYANSFTLYSDYDNAHKVEKLLKDNGIDIGADRSTMREIIFQEEQDLI